MIRFRVGGSFTTRGMLWQVSVNGTNPHPLLPAWHTPPNECCGQWTPDGKYFVFQSEANIWARAEKGDLLGRADTQPVQLTSGPMSFFSPLFSKDGKKLFVVGALSRGELAATIPSPQRSFRFSPEFPQIASASPEMASG